MAQSDAFKQKGDGTSNDEGMEKVNDTAEKSFLAYTTRSQLGNLLKGKNEILDKVCEVDSLKDQYGKAYQYIRRSAKPIGILTHGDAALKIYHMIRENAALPQNLVDSLNDFLHGEMDCGRIELGQGAGFAILSQGFLSVNIWGRGNVLFTQTYTIEAKPPHLSREPLEKTGVACTWEAKIMSYEYELWHKYLESPNKSEDKIAYLTDFIEGNLF